MCLREAPDDYVVLFRLPTHGMVVHSTFSPDDRPAFGHVGLFDPAEFDDVSDDVIIWLTEGPTEPIYEAIEMIDKIERLKIPTLQSLDQTSDNQKSD